MHQLTQERLSEYQHNFIVEIHRMSKDSGQVKIVNQCECVQALFEAGFFVAADFDAGLALEVGFLDAGLALDVGAAFAFDLTAAGFLASPVTDFFAVPFLTVVVFFVVVVDFLAAAVFLVVRVAFLTGSFFAVEVYFLVVAVDLVVAFFAAVVAFDAPPSRPVVVFFVAVGFAMAALGLAGTGFVPADLLETGLVFSLAASTRAFGANLTLPEGPFGRTNVPFSLPVVMARFSWLEAAALSSIRYFDSTNFLIVGRETPARASSGWAMMHALIISTQEGCTAA